MKSNRAENSIRQKISLHEADHAEDMYTNMLWEKLALSMDAPVPAKVRLLRYWPAAAAIVLLVAIKALMPGNNQPQLTGTQPSTAATPIIIPEPIRPMHEPAHPQPATPEKIATARHSRITRKTTQQAGKDYGTYNPEDPSLMGISTMPVINTTCYNTNIDNSLLSN